MHNLRATLWFKPTLTSAAVLVTVLLVVLLDDLPGLPEAQGFESQSVIELLRFVAAGMLTITTVMLSVLVVVLSLAAGHASPRSVPELMADPVTQNALSAFLATLVFSLAAQTLLELGAVDANGITAFLMLALVLVAWAIKYLVQWIHHVADTLKLNKIVERIYNQAHRVLENYIPHHSDGENAERREPSKSATNTKIQAARAGYVQLIDRKKIDHGAEDADLVLDVVVREGDFVHPSVSVIHVASQGEPDGELLANLQSMVVIGGERSLQSDPLLGFELLTEVACRALSPSLNDPQTAIICIDYVRALLVYAARIGPDDYPPRVSESGRTTHRGVSFHDMLKRSIRPVVREGSACAEVICKVAETLDELAALSEVAYLEDIEQEAEQALAFGEKRLVLQRDKEQLRSSINHLKARIRERRAR